MEELITQVEEIAQKMADGHYTILKFTTGYKGFLGTPNLDIGEEREKIAKLPKFLSLEDVLKYIIKTKVCISDL
jgi:hypothetical protein